MEATLYQNGPLGAVVEPPETSLVMVMIKTQKKGRDSALRFSETRSYR